MRKVQEARGCKHVANNTSIRQVTTLHERQCVHCALLASLSIRLELLQGYLFFNASRWELRFLLVRSGQLIFISVVFAQGVVSSGGCIRAESVFTHSSHPLNILFCFIVLPERRLAIWPNNVLLHTVAMEGCTANKGRTDSVLP